MPVIKMSGNPDGYEKRKDIIDIYVGDVIDGEETIQQAGERLLEEVVDVASGSKQTIFEKGTYDEPLLIQIDGPSL
jgi:altronate hydrolase